MALLIHSKPTSAPPEIQIMASSANAEPPPASSWPLRALFAIAVVFLLQLGKPLFLPFVIAVAFTFVLSPLVRRLRRVGVPEAVGAGLVVAAVLAVLFVFVSSLSGPAAEWWERAPATVRQMIESADRLRSRVLTGQAPAASHRLKRPVTPSVADPISDQLASQGMSITGVVLGQMFSFTIEAAATVILLYFLLASEHWLLSRTIEAVRRRRTRALVLGGVRQAQREIGLYLGTMSLINIGLGSITAATMAALGLPNPVLWGAIAAMLNYVPYLGPALMTGLLLLAGSMAFGSNAQMFGPPAAFVLFHAIESNLVTPWVIGRRLRLAPLSVFVSVMVWGWLWGVAGAFVAVPVLLGLRTVCKRSRRFKLACVYLEGDATPPPSLRALLRPRRRSQRTQIG